MNHDKTTLLFGSIVVAGALTGAALAILLKQFLDDREKDLSIIGTPGKNDVKSAHGPGAFSDRWFGLFYNHFSSHPWMKNTTVFI